MARRRLRLRGAGARLRPTSVARRCSFTVEVMTSTEMLDGSRTVAGLRGWRGRLMLLLGLKGSGWSDFQK